MDLFFLLILFAALLGYGGSGAYRARLEEIDAEDAQRGEGRS